MFFKKFDFDPDMDPEPDPELDPKPEPDPESSEKSDPDPDPEIIFLALTHCIYRYWDSTVKHAASWSEFVRYLVFYPWSYPFFNNH
jgi:hypothetical protein